MSRVKLLLTSLCFLFGEKLHAQLCQGNLGDPIVNFTFGQGPNPGSPLPAATTGYMFASNDCPNDGFYTVRNNTFGCFGNSWHSLNADHTGNQGGYFMLVNASYTPGAFYIDTVRGLCAGTNFELSAWILNVLLPSSCSSAGIMPDISFSIEKLDGTVLQTYNTGNIPASGTPQWNKYGLYFTTPTGVNDIVLRLVNNAPGGCGNDIALDDISFRACGPRLTNYIDGIEQSTVSYCQGVAQQFEFSAILSAGFTSPEYQWQAKDPVTGSWLDIPGATGNNYDIVIPGNRIAGNYHYRLAVTEAGNISSQLCRVYSQDFVVTIHPLPTANAGADKMIVLGQRTQLSGSVPSDVSFSWSPAIYIDDLTSLNPWVDPPADQEYTLTVVSLLGCGEANDRVMVKVFKDLYIPTAFTPNNDGLNDTWGILGLDALPDFRLTVYDRWGQIVFSAKNLSRDWDGKLSGSLLPTGVYIYLLDTASPLGLLKGTVTLIR